jgi:spore coat polysaccharide biosynthesis protein SpsF
VTDLHPVVGIIQARMGSSRFPGKMLADFLGHPLLHWVLERSRRSACLDQIVLATSTLERDTPLAEMARAQGIDVFRGNEEDVLGRFVGAAKMANAKIVVRICADRPLIAPEMIDIVVQSYIEEKPDYAYNHIPGNGQSPPFGLGAEVLSAKLLYKLAEVSSEPHQREHVTYYIWDHMDAFSVQAAECPDACDTGGKEVRFDVDHKDDLDTLAQNLPLIDFSVSAAQLTSHALRNSKSQ